MADRKVTDLTAKGSIVDNDILMIVDSETFPEESKKIVASAIQNYISGFSGVSYTANGDITKDDLVGLNYDGTVSTYDPALTPGTPSKFVASAIDRIYGQVIDMSGGIALITLIYRDTGTSNHGYAIAIQVDLSDGSMTIGSPVAFNSANTIKASISKLTSTSFLVTFDNDGTNVSAIIGEISGTTITFGTPVVVAAVNPGGEVGGDLIQMSTNTIFFAYESSNTLRGRIATFSGSVITLGTDSEIDGSTGSGAIVRYLFEDYAIVQWYSAASGSQSNLIRIQLTSPTNYNKLYLTGYTNQSEEISIIDYGAVFLLSTSGLSFTGGGGATSLMTAESSSFNSTTLGKGIAASAVGGILNFDDIMIGISGNSSYSAINMSHIVAGSIKSFDPILPNVDDARAVQISRNMFLISYQDTSDSDHGYVAIVTLQYPLGVALSSVLDAESVLVGQRDEIVTLDSSFLPMDTIYSDDGSLMREYGTVKVGKMLTSNKLQVNVQRLF